MAEVAAVPPDERRRWPIVVGIALLALVGIAAVLAWRYAPVIDHAREARAAAARLTAQARSLGPADVDRAAVSRIRGDLDALRGHMAPLAELIADDPLAGALGSVPGLDVQLEAAAALVAAADAIVEAGELGLGIADRVVEIREADLETSSTPVVPRLVEVMATSAGDVERIGELFTLAAAELEAFPAGAAGPLVDVRDLMADPLDEYGQIVDDYARLDDTLPAILGWGEDRDYLILAQNPAELRPTGGYAGTAGALTLRDGAVVGQRFFNAHIPGRTPGLPFVEAPDPLVNHLLGPEQSWRLPDSNWWADFPASARQALELYEVETGVDDLDGVIAVTTGALDRLLEVTGPVELPAYGVTVEPGDATLELLAATRDEGVDGSDRKEVLDALARELLRRLLALPPERWLPLARAIEDVGRTKQILVWFDDADAQALAIDAGWDGRVRQDEGDYLYVVEANMAPTSKYNLVIDRSRSFQIALDAAGDAFSSVKLSWDNPADRAGEPYASLREFSTDQRGGYGAHVRALVPVGSELVAATGEADGPIRGPEDVGAESGRTVFSNYLFVPPGEARLTYVWTTPGVATADGDVWTYRLTLQRQPGIRPEALALRIDAPEGATIIEAPAAAVIEGARVSLDTTLEADLDVVVRYRLGDAVSD